MATQKQTMGIDINTVLLIGAGVLLWPIIKGIHSAANVAGDILSTPEKFATALNKQTATIVHDTVMRLLTKVATESNYNPYNPKDFFLMQSIQKMTGLTSDEKFYIVSTWTFFKPSVFYRDLAKKAMEEIAYKLTHSLW